ncbi:flagellar associated protein [Haematococcus lacustris]
MAALPRQPKTDSSLGGRSQSETDVGMSQERIKQLMKGDSKFIARLIEQLDKQMHGLMLERQKRQAQLDADLKEMAQLDHTIATNIAPNLEKAVQAVRAKTQLRDQLKQQLAEQAGQLKKMQEEAASLLQATRSMTSKLRRNTASQRLEEARGFSTSRPTTSLLRGEPGAP